MKAVRTFLTSAVAAGVASTSLAQSPPPAGPVTAAAKVKEDRATAEDRIKAVQYLMTVDCHYWPEAEEAFIQALRGDRNEAVRYEAAVALATGCCRTPKVVIALSHSAACSTVDGGFLEMSAQVRQASMTALAKCMSCCNGPDADNNGGKRAADENKPKLPLGDDTNAEMKSYYAKAGKLPKALVLAQANRAMDIGRQLGGHTAAPSNAMDLAAAGVTGQPATSGTSSRPSNLLDMLTGSEPVAGSGTHVQPAMRAGSTASTQMAISYSAPKTPAVAPSKPAEQPVKTAAASIPAAKPIPAKPAPKVETNALTPAAVAARMATPAPLATPKPAAPTPVVFASQMATPAPLVTPKPAAPAPAAVASKVASTATPKPAAPAPAAVAPRMASSTTMNTPKPATPTPPASKLVTSMAGTPAPAPAKAMAKVDAPSTIVPAKLPSSVPANVPAKSVTATASPAEKPKGPMVMTALDSAPAIVPVEPAGFARVSLKPVPTTTAARAIVPASSQAPGVMAEPISIRPAIPARR